MKRAARIAPKLHGYARRRPTALGPRPPAVGPPSDAGPRPLILRDFGLAKAAKRALDLADQIADDAGPAPAFGEDAGRAGLDHAAIGALDTAVEALKALPAE